MEKTYYLVFAVDRIPDLTLTKYSILDGSGVDDIMEKHGVFCDSSIGLDQPLEYNFIYYIILTLMRGSKKGIIFLWFFMLHLPTKESLMV